MENPRPDVWQVLLELRWQQRRTQMRSLAGTMAWTCLLTASASAAYGQPAQQSWPQWRGPLGTGVSPTAAPPIEWSESKHVRWKTAIPGKGHSSPVVWGDAIFLTTAIPHGDPVKPKFVRPGAHDNLATTFEHEFVVLAVSRKTGKILWQKTV